MWSAGLNDICATGASNKEHLGVCLCGQMDVGEMGVTEIGATIASRSTWVSLWSGKCVEDVRD